MNLMRRLSCLSLSLLLAVAWSQSALGALVINGDFGTGDFSGWTLDTDGLPGTANDFHIVGTPGGYQAEIRADYWSRPGDLTSAPLNDVFVANTLYQELDTDLSPGAMMRLTFDWVFTGEDSDAVSGDVFSVALNDGLGNLYGPSGAPGYLINPQRVYGSGSFKAVLDSVAFANTSGWLLEFQLLVGADGNGLPNGLGSNARIANVALAEFVGMPVPASALLLAFGIPLMLRGGRRHGTATD